MSLLDTTQLALESAMSGSMLRQTLLTNDLANANTPDFQPQDVNFQQTLAQACLAGPVAELGQLHALHGRSDQRPRTATASTPT